MSHRSVRRQQEVQGRVATIDADLKKHAESSSSESDEPVVRQNPFAALLGNQGQANSSESESSQEEIVQPVPKKPTKKANKKNKAVPDPTPSTQPEDNFDEVLKQYGAASCLSSQQQTVSVAGFHLFNIQKQFMIANEELKRMFGAAAINTKEKPEKREKPQKGMKGRQKQDPQQALQGRKKNMLSKRALNCNLVKPKKIWPAKDNLFSMELIESQAGINYFRIVWTEEYKKSQDRFYQCVQTGDPNTLVQLLQAYPYQVDTMLQLVEAAKHTGELDMAQDLLERTLFRFELSWPLLFNPFSSHNVRFEYKHQTNRSFFMAMFRHVQLLTRRGCLRTALEFSKFILCLDHSDPLRILLLIDSLCLKTGEFDYLLELYYNNDLFRLNAAGESEAQELELLPNFVFSSALAKFLIEEKGGNKDDYDLPSKKKVINSDNLLCHALMMFPSVVTPLLNKIGMQNVWDEEGTTNFVYHTFFSETREYEKSPLLHQLSLLYLERTAPIWKQQNVQDWLANNIRTVVAKYDAGDAMIGNCKALVLHHYIHESETTEDKDTQRHILLSEQEDAMQTLPPEMLHGGLRIYDEEPNVQQNNQNQEGGMNPLLLFLQSLLPWFDPNAPPQQQQEIMQQLAQQMQFGGDYDSESD